MGGGMIAVMWKRMTPSKCYSLEKGEILRVD
jgi:hypothetical protein